MINSSYQRNMDALYWAAHDSFDVKNLRNAESSLNIAVLYGSGSTFTSTVGDHLNAFRKYSKHEYHYFDSINSSECGVDLNIFDVVIIHYSCGLYHPSYFSEHFIYALKSFAGLKIAFCQDEYDNTEQLRLRLIQLGVQVVYTCVPQQFISNIYPRDRFKGVRFVTTLTGYVPEDVFSPSFAQPLCDRKVVIGYRGRPLHPKYGKLGEAKIEIGRRVLDYCKKNKIQSDIAWSEEDRIYWDNWPRFLGGCRATLATESGSNVFDFDGTIRSTIDEELLKNPAADPDWLWETYVSQHEGKFAEMNQISPKMFESIALRTALVMLEGSYSGVLEPWRHYLPLKKDYSNLAEIIDMVRDDEVVTNLTNTAYQEIISSRRFSFQRFANDFDAVLREIKPVGSGREIVSVILGTIESKTKWEIFPNLRREKWNLQYSTFVNKGFRLFPFTGDALANGTSNILFYYELDSIRNAWRNLSSKPLSATKPTSSVVPYEEILADNYAQRICRRFNLKGFAKKATQKIIVIAYMQWQRLPEKSLKLAIRKAIKIISKVIGMLWK